MPEGVSSRRLFFYTSTTDVVNDASWLRDKLPITKGSLSRSHEPSVTTLVLNARRFEADLRWCAGSVIRDITPARGIPVANAARGGNDGAATAGRCVYPVSRRRSANDDSGSRRK